MLKVGLTGGIGSGKSTVAKIFACLGIPILDSDALAKQLVQTNLQLQADIKSTFGEDTFVNGILQRQVLAAKAFSSSAETKKLNALVHPHVIAASQAWMEKQKAHYAIKEAALLIESESYKQLDFVIGVQASVDTRIRRVGLRNPELSMQEIEARISKQMSDEARAEFCQYSINNNEDDVLIPQVLAIHQQLIKM